MPGAAAPPAGAADPACSAGNDVSRLGGSTGAAGFAGGGEVPGVVGDVGAGRAFPEGGVVFCCVPGAGVAGPAADATGTVSPVPDPGGTDEDEL